MILTIIFSVLLILVVAVGMILWLHPSFGRSPRGERLERISASPNYRNGQFHNIEKTPELTSDKGFLRALWEALFNSPDDKVPSSPVKAMKTDLGALPVTVNQLVWLGHSSYFTTLDGKRILVDPVLTSEFPVSLMMMKPFQGSDIYSPADIHGMSPSTKSAKPQPPIGLHFFKRIGHDGFITAVIITAVTKLNIIF